MISYEFNEELEILEVFYTGDISLLDVLEYGEMIKKDFSLPRDLKILTDATRANYTINPGEISHLHQVMKEQIKPYHSVKTAVIQEKPLETAISMLVDSQGPIQAYQHQVFSSRKAAIKWLLA
jgi:hypothetical protein